MLGRELPCTVVDLLDVRLMPLAGRGARAARAAGGGGPRVSRRALSRLGLSHLGRQELGLAQQRLADGGERRSPTTPPPGSPWPRCATCSPSTPRPSIRSTPSSRPTKPTRPARPDRRVTRYHCSAPPAFCLERCGTDRRRRVPLRGSAGRRAADLFAHHRLAAIYLAHNQLEAGGRHTIARS